jgi:glucuronosyltransferase
MSHTPLPLSYVPMINSAFSDHMTVIERTWNMINYWLQTTAVKIVFGWKLDPVVHQYVDKNLGFLDVVGKKCTIFI